MRVALIDRGVGLVSFTLSSVISNVMKALQPIDIVRTIGVVGILPLVALFDNFVPASRATKVDPITTLRFE